MTAKIQLDWEPGFSYTPTPTLPHWGLGFLGGP